MPASRLVTEGIRLTVLAWIDTFESACGVFIKSADEGHADAARVNDGANGVTHSSVLHLVRPSFTLAGG